jgi:hypothetical protein
LLGSVIEVSKGRDGFAPSSVRVTLNDSALPVLRRQCLFDHGRTRYDRAWRSVAGAAKGRSLEDANTCTVAPGDGYAA